MVSKADPIEFFGEKNITYEQIVRWSQPNTLFSLSPKAKERIKKYRSIIEKKLQDNHTYYGINTGFGYLSNVKIDNKDLQALQVNLIRSHAVGVGAFCDDETVKAMMLLKIHSLAYGHSGASLECVEALLDLVNADIMPLVPQKGSVGASGDLAPLAHVSQCLLGEGKCRLGGNVLAAAEALSVKGLKTYVPKAKEGLSLINGTQLMTALACQVLQASRNIMNAANLIAAASLDAFKGSIKPFDTRIQQIRGQVGQEKVAKAFLTYFNDKDELLDSHTNCDRVQDPYSFRCIPQVHGASLDAIDFVENIVNREINSVTDNPLVFDDGDIISGGNFHGQPVAMALDFLKIAISELGSISERRIEKLTNPNLSDLPAFLVKKSGLNSGFMIAHVTAAALASENKSLCHPAVVDSIPTSADKEDHVSMGPIAGFAGLQVVKNVADILSIELLSACQGLEFHKPLKPNPTIDKLYQLVRSFSPDVDDDRSLHDDIMHLSSMIYRGELFPVLGIKPI